MKKIQKENQKNPNHSKASKKYIIAVSLFCGLIVLIAIASALNVYSEKARRYEEGVGLMRGAIQMTVKDLLASKGGIERVSLYVYRDKYSDSFLCIDVNCPEVTTTWMFVADKGQEESIRQEIIKAISSKRGGNKWSVGVIVGVLGRDERPYGIPEDKEWYNVYIYVTYKPGEPNGN